MNNLESMKYRIKSSAMMKLISSLPEREVEVLEIYISKLDD